MVWDVESWVLVFSTGLEYTSPPRIIETVEVFERVDNVGEVVDMTVVKNLGSMALTAGRFANKSDL